MDVKPTVGAQQVPTVEMVQFQVDRTSGVLFALGKDGSIWFTPFAEGVSSPPPTWYKFWPMP